MAYGRHFSPKFLIFIPVLLVLMIAVACGEDATPTPTTAPATPTATSVPPTPTPTPVPPGVPTPTPRPATPTPTKAPVATPTPAAPGFVTSKTKRLVVSFGKETCGSLVPWLCSGLLYNRPVFEWPGVRDRFNGDPQLQLTTDWSVSADAKTWTWNLREDVPFHFGWGEFTSADLVHAIEQVGSDDSRAREASFYRDLAEVRAPDDHTVVLVQSKSNIFDMPFYWFGIRGNTVGMSKAYWDAEGLDGYKKKPVGTGAYRFVKFLPDASHLSERVEGHWRVTPEFQELEQLFISESATVMAMLLAGEAHIVSVARDLEPVLEAGGMKLVRSALVANFMTYGFGGMHLDYDKLVAAGYDMTKGRRIFFPQELDDAYIKKSPWVDPVNGKLVREALNRAIDRDEIRDTLLRGEGELSMVEGFHPTFAGWNDKWVEDFEGLYGYDPQKARDLLTQAGYPNGFDITITPFERFGVPELVAISEVISGYLEDIGVTVDLDVRPFSVANKLAREKALQGQLGIFNLGMYDSQYAMRVRWSQNAVSTTYEDLFTWEIFDQMEVATTEPERDRLARLVGDHVFYNYLNMPLFMVKASAVFDPKVVAEYAFPGNTREKHTHLEYVKTANPE